MCIFRFNSLQVHWFNRWNWNHSDSLTYQHLTHTHKTNCLVGGKNWCHHATTENKHLMDMKNMLMMINGAAPLYNRIFTT